MRLYRVIFSLVGPLLLIRMLWRRVRGTESRRSLAERLGGGDALAAPATAPRLWLHGASNGELASARELIETLLERAPNLHLIVTCNTETGRALAESWGVSRLHAALAPLDYRWCLSRFLRRHRPRALALIENELWPNRMALAHCRGLPVVMLGARMSAGSARFWARLPALAAAVFRPVVYLSAQDEISARRFEQLGLAPKRIGPIFDLKAAAGATTAVELPPELARRLAPERCILAASTHSGEDEILVTAFARIRAQGHWQRLILAPRHPRRRREIEAAIKAAGLGWTCRSQGALPGADAAREPVYLADTMGEMELWYRAAAVTFVGGSLVARGGHTPFEPARANSVILHGPHVENFAAIYRRLDAAGGARETADTAAIVTALTELSDPQARADMLRKARATIAADAGPVENGHGRDALLAALGRALDLPNLAAVPPSG